MPVVIDYPMATLIPDPVPLNATGGEKELARLLKRSPEEWMVYHEPGIKGARPDFVILAHGRRQMLRRYWRYLMRGRNNMQSLWAAAIGFCPEWRGLAKRCCCWREPVG